MNELLINLESNSFLNKIATKKNSSENQQYQLYEQISHIQFNSKLCTSLSSLRGGRISSNNCVQKFTTSLEDSSPKNTTDLNKNQFNQFFR